MSQWMASCTCLFSLLYWTSVVPLKPPFETLGRAKGSTCPVSTVVLPKARCEACREACSDAWVGDLVKSTPVVLWACDFKNTDHRKGKACAASLRAALGCGLCAGVSSAFRSGVSGLQWKRRVTSTGRWGLGGPGFQIRGLHRVQSAHTPEGERSHLGDVL